MGFILDQDQGKFDWFFIQYYSPSNLALMHLTSHYNQVVLCLGNIPLLVPYVRDMISFSYSGIARYPLTLFTCYSLVCHKHENCRGITSEAFIGSYIAKLKYSTIRIFYTMERIIHLIIASLLLAAMVSIVVPNPVQASPPREWCWKVGGAGMCFDNKEECRKGIPSGISATCQKGVTN